MQDVVARFAAHRGITDATDLTLAGWWDRLAAGGVERPGAAFAAWIDLALVGGALPALLANSPTVGQLLDRLVRFHPLWGDDDVVRTTEGTSTVIALRGADGGEPHPETFRAFVEILDRVLGQLTDLGPGAVRDRVTADGARLEFEAAVLGRPVLRADPRVAEVLTGYAESDLHAARSELVAAVRALAQRDHPVPPTLADAARSLATSTRSLQEGLRAAGTTFAGLVDAARQERALALLADRSRSVTDVAVATGFESVAGFTRAVRRWTGVTPTEWRARHDSR